MTFLKKTYQRMLFRVSKNFRGDNKREIDLGVFDEIFGIFVGFVYVRYFIEYQSVEVENINNLLFSLLISLLYIISFVIISHSNNDNFRLLSAVLLTIGSIALFQGIAFIATNSRNISYDSYLQNPEVEIFQITWVACIFWFFLRNVTEKVLEYLQTNSNNPLEDNTEPK